MAITIAGITLAQGATILNAVISFVQYTLGLSLVALLVIIISNVHSAITWSVIGRELHSSLWPTLLRTYSSDDATAPRITWLSRLGIYSTILVAVAGIITPLGLKSGPLVSSHNIRPMNAIYVRDTSPLASATSSRSNYFYSRPCNFLFYGPCPGGNNSSETSEIDPSIIEQFNSTPHGPFHMQFRRFYRSQLLHRNTTVVRDNNVSIIEGKMSTLESLILRDGLFAVEGAVVDMSDTPGIGLTNHTMPTSLKYGGTWSQEMLWIEPATACVDTNLTIDYVDDEVGHIINTVYLTDRGGFVNLTKHIPLLDRSGQNIDLYQHAYVGAFFNNLYSMVALGNLTRNQSDIGKAFPLDVDTTGVTQTGAMQIISEYYLTARVYGTLGNDCSGYDSTQDIVNMQTVGVQCGIFIGAPYRVDGGDSRLKDLGSKWRQNLHVCASAAKASVQRVDYSFNGTQDLASLKITRSPVDEPILWAVEKKDTKIISTDIYWGPVADSYEFNSNLTTVRSKAFYIPASNMAPEQPHLVPERAWHDFYSDFDSSSVLDFVDYTGSTNAALLSKYQSIVSSNPAQGSARICNLIWTDMVANALLGTDMSTVLSVAEYHPSITYELKYGIPLILLFVIWLPSFMVALFLLASGKLKFSDIKSLLNHTSVGRIVTGYSALTVHKADVDEPDLPMSIDCKEKDWAETAGKILLSYKPNAPADGPKEEIELLHPSTPEPDAGDAFGECHQRRSNELNRDD